MHRYRSLSCGPFGRDRPNRIIFLASKFRRHGMSIELALILIALLLSLWALTWARRAANAAERIAIAAEKNALAAERSAMSARRASEAAEYAAVSTRTPGKVPVVDDAAHSRSIRIDAVVKELMNSWSREASAWPLVEKSPALADDEVDEVIHKAFHLMGRTDDKAKTHTVAVLNMRHDPQR